MIVLSNYTHHIIQREQRSTLGDNFPTLMLKVIITCVSPSRSRSFPPPPAPWWSPSWWPGWSCWPPCRSSSWRRSSPSSGQRRSQWPSRGRSPDPWAGCTGAGRPPSAPSRCGLPILFPFLAPTCELRLRRAPLWSWNDLFRGFPNGKTKVNEKWESRFSFRSAYPQKLNSASHTIYFKLFALSPESAFLLTMSKTLKASINEHWTVSSSPNIFLIIGLKEIGIVVLLRSKTLISQINEFYNEHLSLIWDTA